MSNYEDMKKDELLEEARNREGLSGYSGKNKDDLVELLEQHDEQVSASVYKEAPEGRIMTGATSEEEAKHQEELLKDKPDDYVGEYSEAGQPAEEPNDPRGVPKDNLSENDERDPEDVLEVRQENVIDFPPPLAVREAAETGEEVKGDETDQGARSHLFEQKAVLYTDGLSGTADHNHERAYEVPERLQSNDPKVRAAGDESLSEAAQEQQSDKDKREAKEVKGGSRE